MYISYFKILKKIANILPQKFAVKVVDYANLAKFEQNLKYIKKNKPKVIKSLKNKIKQNKKLNVAFYIYDETKWKAQSLYDLFEQDEKFTPYIFVTKNCAVKENYNYQTKEDIKKVYDFFASKNMRVLYAYDFKKDNYISFEKMNPKPDIIFYCHPWYIEKTQGPTMTSKFALTNYIPYILPTSYSPIEYYLRFHQYIENYYVLNDEIKKYYASNMKNDGKNLKALGHPSLDYFYLNKDIENDKHYVIYAPHWSVDDDNTLYWGTFLKNGKFILDYAKKHPEFNWVFKPHPCLKKYLITHNHYSEDEIENYFREWEKIALVHETGDYIDMFLKSDLMITDCGTFQTEYLPTKKPLIYLRAEHPTEFIPLVKRIVDSYYWTKENNELENLLNEILINKNDYKKQERIKVLEDTNLMQNYCAQNIINDIRGILKIKND